MAVPEFVMPKEHKQCLVLLTLTLVLLVLTLPLYRRLQLNKVFYSKDGLNEEDNLSNTTTVFGKLINYIKTEGSDNEGSDKTFGGKTTATPNRQNITEKAPFYRSDADPEHTEKLPFLKSYRNPCWRELNEDRNSSRIRCLPYFYLVGAPKCGTTDLYVRLRKHPLISNKVQKEQHWLTRKRYYGGRGTLSHYLNYFDEAAQRDLSGIEKNGYHPMVFGDCSASTLWDNTKLLRYHQNTSMTVPPFTNADIIYRLNPDAKILIILRNPITRLYSDYLYFRSSGKSLEAFHNNVVSSVHTYRQCLKKYSPRYCAYFIGRETELRVQIGIYHIYIEDYFRVFPREQVKILKLEEYSTHIQQSMNDVYNFLDLSRSEETALKNIQKRQANSRKETDRKLGDMLPKTWKLLKDFYKPHNEKLVELLGDKFSYN